MTIPAKIFPIRYNIVLPRNIPRSCVIYRKDANIAVSRFVIARFYCSVMVGPESATKQALAYKCEERKG